MYSKSRIVDNIDSDNCEVIILDETESTNLYAKQNIDSFDRNAVILARRQTAGRGRKGRSFLSPEGGLYMTIVLNADKSLGERCFPTVVCAVEVCRAVEECFDLQCEIKWVNDIYLNGKKLCGILCESSSINSKIVIGIGININKPPNGFHPEISDIAVSLSDHIKITDISKLISVIYKNIERHSPVFNIDSVIDEYKARSCVINKEIYVIQNEQKINATAVDITDRGELTVEYFDGRRENLFYGDISVKLNL